MSRLRAIVRDAITSRPSKICVFVAVVFAYCALYFTLTLTNFKVGPWKYAFSNVNNTFNITSVTKPASVSSAPVSLKGGSTQKTTIPPSNRTSIHLSGTISRSSSVHSGIRSTLPPNGPVNPESLSTVSPKSLSTVSPERLTTIHPESSTKAAQRKYFDRIPELLNRLTQANCAALFKGDKNALKEANKVKTTVSSNLTDEFYINATTDCDAFQVSRGYIMSSLTDEEQNFPIAYSLVVYKDSEMVERLLRATYRPQNHYCIHVDLKANESFHKAMAAIAQCFPNVFLSNKRVDVKWGTFTVLESELICMKELWRYKKWKYFINLTGQEFPLKTNFELVKILEAFNGANSISGSIKYAFPKRWRNTKPPLGMRPLKGSVHITANRHFVDYMLHNDTAHALLNWTKRTDIPDETFFTILNFNPQLGIKGSFKGDPAGMGPFISRYKIWDHLRHLCAGHFTRQICILGLGDLPRLGAAVEMFANKFFLWEDRVVIGCLEEKLFNDTRDEYLGVKRFNASYYGSLSFVTNQVI